MDWIKVYNSYRTLKMSTVGASMIKARTTPEVRLAIVKECPANEKNYGAMVLNIIVPIKRSETG